MHAIGRAKSSTIVCASDDTLHSCNPNLSSHSPDAHGPDKLSHDRDRFDRAGIAIARIHHACRAVERIHVAVVCQLRCDGPEPLSPTADHTGPRDDTAGFVGHCGGRLQRGVSMCELDDRGLVTHRIID
jgi:hypothetical protein